MSPQHPNEYPDPDVYPDPEAAPQQRQAPGVGYAGDYPDPEGDYPDPQVPPPHHQPGGSAGAHWSAQFHTARERAGQLGQQFSQAVSERSPEWTASARQYRDDFAQRSAQQASEVSASTRGKLEAADAVARRDVLGRPLAVVVAQGVLAVATLAAFVGTANFAGRFFAAPRRWMSLIQSPDTSYLGAVDDDLAEGAQQIQAGAAASADGLATAPLLMALPVLLLYCLAIFGMWFRMPRARTLSWVLAGSGAIVTFIVLATPLRVLVAWNARGFLLVAAVLGIVGMILMLLPAVNDWVARKYGPGPVADYVDAGKPQGLNMEAMDPDQPVPQPQKSATREDY
ncbi:hypothetical protein [Nesterenkonia populi]